jgi:predicted DNA binding CopG/RHH family protein
MSRPILPDGLSKEKKLEVRLSLTELNAIRNIANSQNITVSKLFRIALKQYAQGLINKGRTTRIGELPDTF